MNDEFWNRLFEIVIYDRRDGALYKLLISINTKIYKIGITFNAEDSLTNHLWTLIKLYPTKKWNRDAILENPNTALNLLNHDIFSELTSDWYQFHLSNNPNLTFDFIQTHDYAWNLWGLIQNKNIPLQYLLNTNFKVNENSIYNKILYFDLSYCPNLTWDFIKKHLDKHWDWPILIQHPCITLDIVIEFNLWHENFSVNPNVTMEIVTENPNFGWDYDVMSSNPNLTWKFITECEIEKWNWYEISKHKNITWQIIFENPKMPWDNYGLSMNPNIELKTFISKEYSDFTKNTVVNISNCKDLTWRVVRDHPDNHDAYRWNWDILSRNIFNKKMSIQLFRNFDSTAFDLHSVGFN
jgi:hypothetical protein